METEVGVLRFINIDVLLGNLLDIILRDFLNTRNFVDTMPKRQILAKNIQCDINISLIIYVMFYIIYHSEDIYVMTKNYILCIVL